MIRSLFFLVFFFPVFFVPAALADQKPAVVIPTHEQMTKQAIRQQMQVLRQQRYQQMPYLDRGFVREVIRPDKIQEKAIFLSGNQKQLKDLIDRAVQVHTRARAAKERIALAKRRIFMAVRGLFPEVNFEQKFANGLLSGEEFGSRSSKFSFRQPLFRGGMLWNTLLQEKALLEAARKDYQKVAHDLVFDVSEAYFEYNRALQVLDDQTVTIAKIRPHVEISQQKFDAELISEIEHLNVQSIYSQMQYDYETAKQELELAKLDLQRFLALTSGDEVAVKGVYQTDKLMTASQGTDESDVKLDSELTGAGVGAGSAAIPKLDELVDMAYKHRAELQVQAAKLKAARLEHRIKTGALFPQADIVMEFGRLGEAYNVVAQHPGLRPEWRVFMELKWNALGNTIGYNYEKNKQAPSVTQYMAGAGSQTNTNTLTVGFLDGLQALVSAKEAEAEKIDQVVELENAEKQVMHDVKQAYYDYQKARIQVKSSLKRVDYRERLVRLNEHRLEQNETQGSEYLQAEVDLMRERTELHKALRDYFVAKAKLNQAVGLREFLPTEDSHG